MNYWILLRTGNQFIIPSELCANFQPVAAPLFLSDADAEECVVQCSGERWLFSSSLGSAQ
jgi:hypothetical protein